MYVPALELSALDFVIRTEPSFWIEAARSSARRMPSRRWARVDDHSVVCSKSIDRRSPPLPTSMDLCREPAGRYPDSFQYLLHDLFEKNTFLGAQETRRRHQTNAAPGR